MFKFVKKMVAPWSFQLRKTRHFCSARSQHNFQERRASSISQKQDACGVLDYLTVACFRPLTVGSTAFTESLSQTVSVSFK